MRFLIRIYKKLIKRNESQIKSSVNINGKKNNEHLKLCTY